MYNLNFGINGRSEILKILKNNVKEKSTQSKKKKEANEDDDRDIDQLLEFIQGEDKEIQEKKEKRKNKQKSKEGGGLEADFKVQEAKAKEKSATAKNEEESNICFRCRSPAISTKLSKCRGCLKVIQYLWPYLVVSDSSIFRLSTAARTLNQ